MKENLKKGQNVAKFKIIIYSSSGKPIKEIKGTTVGHKRIISFPAVEAASVKIIIEETKSAAILQRTEAYLIDEKLIEK